MAQEEIQKQPNSEKAPMPDDKKRRLIMASVVGGILLVCILLGIMIFQIVTIVNKNKAVAELESRIKEFYILCEIGQDTIKIRSVKDWILRRAAELGYDLPDWEILVP